MANLASRVAKTSWPMIATLVRSIFEQPDRDATWSQLGIVVSKLTEAGFTDVALYLLDAADDVLAFSAFPPEHWPKIRSNNPQERLNKEIRRRTDVVGIFPNRAAVIRLVGAVLAEQSDEWLVAKRYMSIESLKSPRRDAPCEFDPRPAIEDADGQDEGSAPMAIE
jgi:transposase-like protein